MKKPPYSVALEHRRRVEYYLSQLKKMIDNATNSYVALSLNSGYDGDDIFSFDKFPLIKEKANQIARNLAYGMDQFVLGATSAEWSQGTNNVNALVGDLAERLSPKVADGLMKSVTSTNDAALRAFQMRKIGDVRLMQKVRDIAARHKIETELALSIKKGRSAEETAKAITKIVDNPKDLFKKARSQFGGPQLDKATKEYHIGTGPTTSSLADAMRLARTEINMAYRNAEIQSYQDKDWIVGYEVKRSRKKYHCPVCDALAGRYPKDFDYSGWHPNCRCYVVAIMYTDAEMEEYFSNGMKPIKSVNEVTDLPDGMKQWIAENSDRIANAEAKGTLPYFIRDNKAAIDKVRSQIVHPSPARHRDTTPSKVEDSVFRMEVYGSAMKNKTIRDMVIRYETAVLTPEEKTILGNEIKRKVAIQTRWNLRKAGFVDGLTYEGLTLNHVYGVKGVNGLTENLYCDIVTYRDKHGRTFSYVLGSNETNARFSAKDASWALADMKHYWGDTIKGLVSNHLPDPYEAFYRKLYSGVGFDSASMYAGEIVAVYGKIDNKYVLQSKLYHEASHNIDVQGIQIFGVRYSEMQSYSAAIKADNRLISEYSKANAIEDFAEHLADFALRSDEGREIFKRIFPNRYGVFRSILGRVLPSLFQI